MPESKPLVVTYPDDDLYGRLADLRARYVDRIEFIPWGMEKPLPADLAQQVKVVLVGHYWGGRDWSLLNQFPNLKVVQLPSAGFEHAAPHVPPGVTLCNGRGVPSTGTAELTLAMVLAAQRGMGAAVDAQRREHWHAPFLTGLADRRVLVVGAGSVADAIIKRLEPFEVDLTVVARTARTSEDGRRIHGISELPQLLPQAEIVIIAVPHDASTHQLFDHEMLAALPDNALVVNVARGKVVHTDALVAELASGRLRAALDVTDPEPLPPGHPLWRTPNTIIIAHQGSHTDATYPRYANLVRRQLIHLLNDEPLENVISLPTG